MFSSTAWVAADKWGSRIMQLGVFTLLGRFLSVRDFGLIALASVVIVVTTTLVDQGFGKALIQRDVLEPEHADAAFWTAMGLSTVLAGLVVLIAHPLSLLLGEPALTNVIRWLAISLPIGAVSAAPAALMQRDFQYRSLAIRHLIGNLAGGVTGVVCAVSGAGIWSLVAQTLTGAAISSAVLWRVSAWRPRMRLSRRHFLDLWGVGLSVLGIDLTLLVNQQADRLIVGAIAGPTALGYYFIGVRLLTIAVESLTSVIFTVALPAFSRVQNDLARVRSMLYGATRLSATISIPVFAAMAALAPLLIPVLFGDKWGPSIPVMQVLTGLGAMSAVAYFDGIVLIAVGKQRWALGITTGQAVLNVVFALIFASHGLIAVAIGLTARQYIFWPVRLYALRRAIGIDVIAYLRQWLTAVVASLPLVASIVLLRPHLGVLTPLGSLVALSLIGGAVYALVIALISPATGREVVDIVRRR